MFLKSKLLKIVVAIRSSVWFVAGHRQAGSKLVAISFLDRHFLV